MRWIRKNYKGDEQVWYSEEDIIKCVFIVCEIKRILKSNKLQNLPFNIDITLGKKLETNMNNELLKLIKELQTALKPNEDIPPELENRFKKVIEDLVLYGESTTFIKKGKIED